MKPARAKEWFDTAERLAPDDFKVLSGAGNYWAAEKDFKKARSYYERAIKIAPGMPSAYTGMGEYFENDKDLETARKWYLKAIEAASGNSSGYEKLLKLYGRPELFKEHEGELQTLMQRALVLSPEDEYQLYIDLGDCYEQNERFGEAQSWYEKAISLDPKRPRATQPLPSSTKSRGERTKLRPRTKKSHRGGP